ncbi:MAG TPA: hypothetical protein V6C95_06455 [Coleofasciculaceae cyanobacterium]
MRHIEINLLNQRPIIQLRLPRLKPSKIIHQVTQVFASTALVASLTGYGALMLGRDVSCGIALGTAGTIAYLVKEDK